MLLRTQQRPFLIGRLAAKEEPERPALLAGALRWGAQHDRRRDPAEEASSLGSVTGAPRQAHVAVVIGLCLRGRGQAPIDLRAPHKARAAPLRLPRLLELRARVRLRPGG